MHVLQVTPYFPPTWAYGGIPRIVDGLSRALVDRGHQVTVLTTDAFDGRQRAPVPAVRDEGGVVADLHAATSKTLSLPFEEEEKELLRISEYLGLRGAEVDAQHAVVIAEQRDWLTRKALDELPSLTLTVIDGSLPVEVMGPHHHSAPDRQATSTPAGSKLTF